jgi:flagellar hook-associated protein 2
MGISVGGLVSGMDTESIISKLQAIEQKPIALIKQKESDYQVKLSAYSQLQSSLSGVKTAVMDLEGLDNVNSYSATSSNTSLISVTAATGAIGGNYTVTVNAMAAAQKLQSGAFPPTEAVGEGTIHLAVGTNAPVDIAVSATATLSDIASSINAAGAGIKANVVFDGTSDYLMLTGNATGAANSFSVTVTEAGTAGLSRLTDGSATALTQFQAASDADITVDGIKNIKRSSNTISDVISGVTLNLNAFDAVKPAVTVAVNQDNSLLNTRINAFVTAYNSLADTLNTLQSYDASTKKTGTLFGDFTVRNIQSQLESLINNPIPGLPAGANRLSDMGIKLSNADQKAASGKLAFDSTALNTQLQNSFNAVSNFFTSNKTGSKGFSALMVTSLQNMLNTQTGTIGVKTAGIQSTIDSLGKQVDDMNTRLAANETRLRNQFNALEVLLGQYKTTSDMLTQQITQWNNSSSSSK